MELRASIGRPNDGQPSVVELECDGTRFVAAWGAAAQRESFEDGLRAARRFTLASRLRAERVAYEPFRLAITFDRVFGVEVRGDFCISGGSFAEFLPLPGGQRVLVGVADHQVAVEWRGDANVRTFDTQAWFHRFELVDDIVLMKTELDLRAFDAASLELLWNYASPCGAPFSHAVDVEHGFIRTFDDLAEREQHCLDLRSGRERSGAS